MAPPRSACACSRASATRRAVSDDGYACRAPEIPRDATPGWFAPRGLHDLLARSDCGRDVRAPDAETARDDRRRGAGAMKAVGVLRERRARAHRGRGRAGRGAGGRAPGRRPVDVFARGASARGHPLYGAPGQLIVSPTCRLPAVLRRPVHELFAENSTLPRRGALPTGRSRAGLLIWGGPLGFCRAVRRVAAREVPAPIAAHAHRSRHAVPRVPAPLLEPWPSRGDLGDVPRRIRIMGETSSSSAIARAYRRAPAALLAPGTSPRVRILQEAGHPLPAYGWVFDVDGRILETPGEPRNSTPGGQRLCHGAYPTTSSAAWSRLHGAARGDARVPDVTRLPCRGSS